MYTWRIYCDVFLPVSLEDVLIGIGYEILLVNRKIFTLNEVPFPPFKDKLVRANHMGSFFVEKINTIHTKLDGLAAGLPDVSCDNDDL